MRGLIALRMLPSLSAALAILLPAHASRDVLHVPARVELLSGWREAEGERHVAGVRIRLEDGWKTYWRAPGAFGLPPRFQWDGNYRGFPAVHYPAPSIFTNFGVRTIGYDQEVIFPILVRPAKPLETIRLDGSMIIGVCREVCIPAEFDISGILEPTDTEIDLRIRDAMNSAPVKIDSALHPRRVRCDISRNGAGDSISVEIDGIAPRASPMHAVFEYPDPLVHFGDAEIEVSGETLSARAALVHRGDGPLAIDRSLLRITLLHAGKATEFAGCSRS